MELISEFAKDWKKLSEDDKKKYTDRTKKSSEGTRSNKNNAMDKHRIPVNNSRSAIAYFNDENKDSKTKHKWNELSA
jgi:hypothetical protein